LLIRKRGEHHGQTDSWTHLEQIVFL
jgi:hypothetical protein